MSALNSPFLSICSAVILSRTAGLSNSPLRFSGVSIERKARTPEATIQHAEARLVSKAGEQYTYAKPARRRLHEFLISSPQRPGKGKWYRSLAEERPDLAEQWVKDPNGDVTPESVSAGSNFRAAWQCGSSCKVCGRPHEWHASVNQRFHYGTGCPMCNGRKVCACQSLAEKQKDLMAEWDFEANKDLNPQSLACLSSKKACWKCQRCGHKWTACVRDRVGHSQGCPECAILYKEYHSKRGLLKDEHPEVFTEVHPSLNAEKDFSSLTCGSITELWWLCKSEDNRPKGCQCEHIWKATVHDRCKVRRRSGCPYCSGGAVCRCKSVAQLHPALMQHWCYKLNADLDPEAVGASSAKKAWFKHICVDGVYKVQQIRVYSAVIRFKKTERLSCRKCAGKRSSANSAERLIPRK